MTIMRTLARAGSHTVVQDINGSVFLDGKQYDSAMDAAWHAPDEVRKEMIRQVYNTQCGYVDGPTALENWKKISEIDGDGFKELTDSPQLLEGGSNE